MPRPALALAVAVLILPGCGGGPDALARRLIDQFTELAVAFEKKESKETIEGLYRKVGETQQKIKALNLSDGEKKRLDETYDKRIRAVMERVVKAQLEYAASGRPLPALPKFTAD